LFSSFYILTFSSFLSFFLILYRNGRNTNQIGNSATDVDIHKGTGQPVNQSDDGKAGGWVSGGSGGGLLDLMDEIGTN
jgi:hypothetical protein